jgi:hypothetical protein
MNKIGGGIFALKILILFTKCMKNVTNSDIQVLKKGDYEPKNRNFISKITKKCVFSAILRNKNILDAKDTFTTKITY